MSEWESAGGRAIATGWVLLREADRRTRSERGRYGREDPDE